MKKIYANLVDYSVWPHKVIHTEVLNLDNIDKISATEDGKVRVVTGGYSVVSVYDEIRFSFL